MDAEKFYTSRLGAGLGMIHETLDLLRLWQPGLTPLRLAKQALEVGLFSRTTARRSEDLAVEMFGPALPGQRRDGRRSSQISAGAPLSS